MEPLLLYADVPKGGGDGIMLPLFGGTSPALPQPRLFTASASVPRSSVFGVFLWGGGGLRVFATDTPPPREPRCGEGVCPLEAFAIELMLAYLSRALP